MHTKASHCDKRTAVPSQAPPLTLSAQTEALPRTLVEKPFADGLDLPTPESEGFWTHSLILATALWGGIILFFIAQDIYSQYLLQDTVYWLLAFEWVSGWIYWIPLTPVCWWITVKYPIDPRRLWTSGLRLLGLGVGICAVLFVLEVLHHYCFTRFLGNPAPLGDLLKKMLFYKLQLNLLAYGILMGVTHAWNYYRRARAYELEAWRQSLRAVELERTCTQARLQALQMQLRPHFLFNTHHAIIGLMVKGETKKAIKMLTSLSDLLRQTLDNAQVQTVALRQELAWLDQYLMIQKTRFGDRLEVRIEAQPEALAAYVPCLILQPLVENSIRHGIEENPAPGWIEVRACRNGDWLELSVCDSGSERADSQNQAESLPGTGLTNTQARLQQLYGTKHRFKSRFGEEKEATVWLAIPFLVQPPTASTGVAP